LELLLPRARGAGALSTVIVTIIVEAQDGKQRDAVLSTVVVTTMVQTKDGKQREAVLSSVACMIHVTAKDGARAWGCYRRMAQN
jgi:predicted Zn-dependent protease